MIHLVKIQIHRYKCIACGFCVSIAPEMLTYSSQDGRVSWVNTANFSDDTQTIDEPALFSDIAQELVNVCPVQAIKIVTS